MHYSLGIDNILSGVRAVLAKELVGRGFSQREISEILGTSPAAVTLYAKGKRGGELSKLIRADKNASLVIDNLMERLIQRNAIGAKSDSMDLPRDTFPLILDATYRIMRLVSTPSGEKSVSSSTVATIGNPPIMPSSSEQNSLTNSLVARLEEEQLAAQRNMALAVGTTDEVARTIFRQIATDSIRHAEIISFLMSKPKDDSKTQSSSKSIMIDEEIAQIEAMIKGEESATEKPIKPKGIDPSLRLLLKSIDIDEEKHKMLLKGLLAISKKAKGYA